MFHRILEEMKTMKRRQIHRTAQAVFTGKLVHELFYGARTQ